MDKHILFQPKNPTYPIPDKFSNQLIVHFGSSKIEDATILIASGMVANGDVYNGQLLPETIADESYAIALACLEKVHDEYLKASATSAEPMIKDPNGQWPETKS